jgi:hypothetical protein
VVFRAAQNVLLLLHYPQCFDVLLHLGFRLAVRGRVLQRKVYRAVTFPIIIAEDIKRFMHAVFLPHVFAVITDVAQVDGSMAD